MAPKRHVDDDEDADPSDFTPITDFGTLTRKIGQIAESVALLPDVKKNAQEARDGVIRLDTTVKGLDHRVSKVEDKLDKGHDCYQVDVIAKIVENGRSHQVSLHQDEQEFIRSKARIESIESNVDEIKKTRKWITTTLIGLIMSIGGGIGSAIWFAAKLEARVEAQEQARMEQMVQFQQQIRTTTQQNSTKLIQQIDQLENAIKLREETRIQDERLRRLQPRKVP